MNLAHRTIYLLLFISGSLVFFGCGNSNDVSTNDTGSNLDIKGTWMISTYIYTTAYDINKDGTSSTDFLTERPCYTFEVTFTANGDYTINEKTIASSIANANCGANKSSKGNYAINGNKIGLYANAANALLNTGKLSPEFIIEKDNIYINDTHATLGKQVRSLKKK